LAEPDRNQERSLLAARIAGQRRLCFVEVYEYWRFSIA
jgi:hypothetical protein